MREMKSLTELCYDHDGIVKPEYAVTEMAEFAAELNYQAVSDHPHADEPLYHLHIPAEQTRSDEPERLAFRMPAPVIDDLDVHTLERGHVLSAWQIALTFRVVFIENQKMLETILPSCGFASREALEASDYEIVGLQSHITETAAAPVFGPNADERWPLLDYQVVPEDITNCVFNIENKEQVVSRLNIPGFTAEHLDRVLEQVVEQNNIVSAIATTQGDSHWQGAILVKDRRAHPDIPPLGPPVRGR